MIVRKQIRNLLITITAAAWITVPASILAASQTFYVSTQAVGSSSDSDFYIVQNATNTLVNTTELIAGSPLQNNTNINYRIYLKFDLTGLPTMGTVTNAILRLYWKVGNSYDTYGSAVVFARTAEFVPGGSSDYAELVGNELGTIATGDAPGGGMWKELDITAAVEAWRANGLGTYFGLAIRGSEGYTQTGKYFDSRTEANSPQLVVQTASVVPSDMALSSSTVAENQPVGTTVGTLSTVGGAAPYTYTLVAGTGDTDNGSFQINGSSLQTLASLDYEAGSTRSIRVRTTEADAETFEKEFTITVTNVNEPPVMMAVANVQSGTMAVGTARAVDPENGTLTYSITGGADMGLFSIVPGTGVLTIPGGAGAVGTTNYVEVGVSDGTFANKMLIEVIVVNEAVPEGTVFRFY